MFCVHLSDQRLRLSADLIVRLLLRLSGTSSGPRVWQLPSTALLGVGPPSLHSSCSVLPRGHLHSASCRRPQPVGLGWNLWIYLQLLLFTFSFGCLSYKTRENWRRNRWSGLWSHLHRVCTSCPHPGRWCPRSLSWSRSLGVSASCPHPGGWCLTSLSWSHSLGVSASCPHSWRLVPAGPSRGLASGFAGNMLRSRLSAAQQERSLAPPSSLREPGRAGVGAHRGWAKVCWVASEGMRSHLSHRLTLGCLIWTFGLSVSLWILKCL